MAFGNDVNTMTPGSAVADSLEDILTRKRNESRQAMLDSVTRQSAQARANYENAAAASLTEQRDAQAQYRKAQADAMWQKGQGDNPSQVDQATYQRGMRVAPSSYSATPAKEISASEFAMPNGFDQADPSNPVQSQSVTAPGTFNYLGSDKYRTRQQTIEGLQKLSADPAFSKAAQNELKLAAIDPQWNPEGALAKIMTSKTEQAAGHLYGVDPVTHKRIDLGTMGPNDKSMEFTRPPQTPAADTPFISGTTEDPITHVKSPATFRVSPTMIGKDGLVRYPAGFTPEGKLGTTPRVPPVKPAKVDDKDWSLYINAKSAALRSPDDPKTEDLLNSQANKVINTSTNDSTVKAFISKAWTYKQARSLPADVIMSKMKEGSTPLTEPQKQEITQIWNQLKFDSQGQ